MKMYMLPEYKVKLGEKEFYGCLMPHEEVLILGKNFDMEVGFLYRINEYTTNIIRQNLNKVEDHGTGIVKYLIQPKKRLRARI